MGSLMAVARAAGDHKSLREVVAENAEAVDILRSKGWTWGRIAEALLSEGLVASPVSGSSVKRYRSLLDTAGGRAKPAVQARRFPSTREKAVPQEKVVDAAPKEETQPSSAPISPVADSSEGKAPRPKAKPTQIRPPNSRWTDVSRPAKDEPKGRKILMEAGLDPDNLPPLVRPLGEKPHDDPKADPKADEPQGDDPKDIVPQGDDLQDDDLQDDEPKAIEQEEDDSANVPGEDAQQADEDGYDDGYSSGYSDFMGDMEPPPDLDDAFDDIEVPDDEGVPEGMPPEDYE